MRGKVAATAVVLTLLGLFTLTLTLRQRVTAAGPATSQNGWTVIEQAGTESYQVAGSKVKLRLRKGDAATVLLDVAAWFDRSVEDIDVGGDDWGWAVRKIEGSSSYSNHASGTAIDLNAQKHPQGVATTKGLSAAQINQVHARLNDRYKGVIRWGGDYKSRPDAMHFEVNKNAAAVKAVADAIRLEALAAAAPKAPPPPAPAAPAPKPTAAPAPPTTKAPPPSTVDAAAQPLAKAPGEGEEHQEDMGPVEAPALVEAPVWALPAQAVPAAPAFTG
jgi:hypothetical protein